MSVNSGIKNEEASSAVSSSSEELSIWGSDDENLRGLELQDPDADEPFETEEILDHIDGLPLRIVDVSEPMDGAMDADVDRQPRSRTSSPEAIAALVDSIRLSSGDLADITDFDLKRRIKDFRFAQSQRRRRYSHRPYGIIGLFVNLSDTRADLRWAEDAAWRRNEHMPYVRWRDYESARQQGMNRSYFTYTMMLVFVALMVVAFYLNGWKVEPWKVNPFLGPKPEVLLRLGALQMRIMVETGSWYRLVTAVLLHAGILHILLNLVAFGLLCRAIERNHGPLSTAILFFTSAIGGNIISCLMQPEYILLGASGGIFGLIGICVADIVLNWKLLFLVFRNQDGSPARWTVKFCSMFWLFFDLASNSIIGFTPYVDNFAHLGGLAYGFLLSLTVLQRLPLAFFGRGNGIYFKIRIGTLRIMGAILAAALLVVTSILMSESDGIVSPCYRCRYISCVPFPFWQEKKWWYCDGCTDVSAKVFRRGDNTSIFTDLDLTCPYTGKVVAVNISGDGYVHASAVEGKLSAYCRKYC